MLKLIVSSLFKNLCVPKSIQSSRNLRRFPYKPWHPRRRVIPYWTNKELTAENREFLRSTYENFNPISSQLQNVSKSEWNIDLMRTGVLALKIGVVPQWTKEGNRVLCTLLQVLDNHVIQVKEPQPTCPNHHITIVGALSTGIHKFTKEYYSLFEEAGILPKRKITRFVTSAQCILPPGTELTARHFKVGHYVDAQAKTIGHGFQGVVKRWGFKGGPASHGTTKWHRRPGAIGGGAGKSKVFKGKKMPGKMGMKWRTQRGLKILRINEKHNVLYIQGSGIPGPIHCYVRLYDTCLPQKRSIMEEDPPPNPTFIEQNPPTPEDKFDQSLFRFETEFVAKET